MITYRGVLIAVQDIAISRQFYEDFLEQKVGLDFGVNVSFEGGLAIHQKDHFQGLLGDEISSVVMKSHGGELYFETDQLEKCEQRLQAEGVSFLHPIREQPWAQRVMRVYDPDGHVVEIGETMEAVVLRLSNQGSTPEAIAQRTGMPISFVENALKPNP